MGESCATVKNLMHVRQQALILKSFTKVDGAVRIVVSTVAFQWELMSSTLTT